MIGTSLNRQKVLLALLAQACRQRQRARLVLPDHTEDQLLANTRFLDLHDEELYVERSAVTVTSGRVRGQSLDVYFECGGERLAFRTRVIGPSLWCGAHCRLAAWKLEVPLQIERKQQRAHYRVSLADLGRIPVEFTRVADVRDAFKATLINVSGGGLGSSAPIELAERVHVRDMYWTRFNLPEEPERFEFVVRLMHMRRAEKQELILLGCRFCPTDEPRLYRAQLRRLELFIARRQRAKLSRIMLHDTPGE